MSTCILGINCHAHDSSVALLQDGQLVFAAAEERFSRIKKDRGFPQLAVQAALDHVGVEFAELDAIAFGWNRPGVGPLHTIRRALTGQLPLSRGWTVEQLYHLASELRHKGGSRPLRKRFGNVDRRRVYYIDHHESHAWSAYALSPFDEALVLVMDGWGAWQATTIYHAQGGNLRPVRVFAYPNSLGVFYESFTDLLGFERQNDEWKVMGLAAYGEPHISLQDCIRVMADGYQVDSKLLAGKAYGDLSMMIRKFGPQQEYGALHLPRGQRSGSRRSKGN